MNDRPPPELDAELERLLLVQLKKEWAHLNWLLFRERLRLPAIALVESRTVLARWVSEPRLLEVSRALVLDHPWGVVVEVLKHEMAHQYVDEVLGVFEETAHGPSFRELCAKLGIDAAAAGAPTATPSDDGTTRLVERIRKLLALAASPNRHEAEAAMRQAQRLMLEHNLEEVRTKQQRGYAYRHLGKPTRRREEHERLLATILQEHFFVEVIYVSVYVPLEGRTGSVIEVCGSETSVAMAAYVHDFLLHTAERLWREHKRGNGIRGDRDRRSFLAGVMRGFRDKLEAERQVQKGAGIVWVGDPELSTYFRRRHPRVTHVRSMGRAQNDVYAQGREAGREIVLHKPLESGPSAGGPKLLRG